MRFVAGGSKQRVNGPFFVALQILSQFNVVVAALSERGRRNEVSAALRCD